MSLVIELEIDLVQKEYSFWLRKNDDVLYSNKVYICIQIYRKWQLDLNTGKMVMKKAVILATVYIEYL